MAGSSSAPPRRTSPRSKRSPSAGAAMASTCGTGRASGPIQQDPSWSKSLPNGKQATFSFRPVELDPALGMLSPSAQPTGWYLSVSMKQADQKDVAPALPDRCPQCGQKGYNGDSRIFWRGEVRSPVRGHTTGIAQSTQLYLSQLVRSMGDTPAESRTILFTDSRDDAARTAAGRRAQPLPRPAPAAHPPGHGRAAARPAGRAQEGGSQPGQPRRQRAVRHEQLRRRAPRGLEADPEGAVRPALARGTGGARRTGS